MPLPGGVSNYSAGQEGFNSTTGHRNSLGDINLVDASHSDLPQKVVVRKYRATYSIHWIKNKTNHCCPYQMTPPGISTEDDDYFALKTRLKFLKRGWNISAFDICLQSLLAILFINAICIFILGDLSM
ncbi:hypothetical protein E2320_006980 [Naja naja]|nr:hypothetical protein E2320_006980 [Naja naja]